MYSLLLLLFAAGLSSASVASRYNFYRKDYTFVEEFNAFYKVHWSNNEGNWSLTYQACEEEGAELFYPKTRNEWTVVNQVMTSASVQYPPVISNIFVGLREKFEDCEFSVMKGSSTSYPKWSFETFGEGMCVTLDIHTGILVANDCDVETGTPMRFVCKKDRDLIKDPTRDVSDCPTIGYQYSAGTKKCYKFSDMPKNWCKAMETCLIEGGLLLSMQTEFESVITYINPRKHEKYYTGVRRQYCDQEYYNAMGLKPNVTGFTLSSSYGTNDCVTVFSVEWSSTLESVNCNSSNHFICEIMVSG